MSFAALGGASRHSQIDWEKGKSFPNAHVLAKWAEAGADIQYIVVGIRSMPINQDTLTPREAALIDNYRHVEDESDKKFIERAAFLAATTDEQHEATTKKKTA